MVDIIVVHQNILCVIKEFMECLEENTTLPYRLIVVDNDSKNESIDYIRQKKSDGKIDILIEADPSKKDEYFSPCDLTENTYFFEKYHWCTVERDGENILTHGECLDIASEYIESEFYVTIDSDCFVKKGWLDRMMKEMEDPDVCSTGDSKLGPYNTTRIWVANCLTRTEMYKKGRTTFQPVKMGNNYFDTGDFLSTMLWMQFKHTHISEYMEYWNHVSSLTWFSNCLNPEDKFKDYRFYDENENYITGGSRPDRITIGASECYKDLLKKHSTKDVDFNWTEEDHMKLVKKIEEVS
jgi:GT2 family glycosyltransferase